MRRDALIDHVAMDCGLRYEVARDVIAAFCDTVADLVCKGETVPLPGIGQLWLRETTSRENRIRRSVAWETHPVMSRRVQELAGARKGTKGGRA